MFQTQVGRLLDEEHRANLALLGRIEQAVARARQCDSPLAALLREFAHAMEHDIGRHFRFEEEQLFPLLVDFGDGAMVALMLQEHADIREIAAELLPLAHAGAAGTLDTPAWDRLRLGVLELVERQVSHIQKETMAVIPLLEDVLDADLDQELAMGYAAA